MASVKVKFRASSVADREGRLFYQIIHNRVTRQISSGHKLFPSEWEVLQRNILPPNCEGPRHAYLVALKSRIADDKARLERIISRLEHTGESYTAGDVAARYLTPPDAGGFLSFARSLAGQLRQIGKIRTSERYTTVLNSFGRFRRDGGVEDTCMSVQFSHIMAGGYSAGYYSYKWAEVLDADAFSLFKEKGIFNQEVAASFRENILSKGGTEHPMTLYKRFRGQEPSIHALLKRNGIIN